MEMNHCLPFKVGQEAESKSFLEGFRGAWFRCKIKDIRTTKGRLDYALEYFDFPDEKIRWSKVYQKPLNGKVACEENKMHLMVRPSFPPIFCESQMPDKLSISEVVAIVNDVWKVGDLVDWWTDGCYWSGTITHLLGGDKVKVKLPDPPVGEGMFYEASCKDLRPSLDWSLTHGWTVPISKESETTHNCARLIQPINQCAENKGHCADKEEAHCQIRAASSHGSSDSSRSSARQTHTETNKEVPDFCENEATSVSPHGSSAFDSRPNEEVLDSGHKGLGEATLVGSVSGQPNEDASAATVQTTGRRDGYNCLVSMNTSFSDTIESSVLDLEELANRIKWLKRVHQFGLQSANAMVPSWKFLEGRVSIGHR